MKSRSNVPLLNKLIANGQRKTYTKGETIDTTEDMDGIYMVKKGFVKRFEIMNNGSINNQGIYGVGDMFSLSYVYTILLDRSIYTGPETYYYEAINDVVLYKLTGKELKAEVEKNPLIYRDLFSVAGNRLLSNIQLLESQALANAEKRVAHLILFYTEHYGDTQRIGKALGVPLTQQDLADILSLTRESVSLAISSLKKQGLVKGTRKLYVPDLEKLREEAFE